MARKYTRRPDGRYVTRLKVGEGKYKYIYANSAKELDQRITQIKLDMAKGLENALKNDTFECWANKWLKNKELQVSNKRYLAYKSALKRFEPLFDRTLTKLRTSDFQDIINNNSNELSEYSLQRLKTTARQICELAITDRAMDYNPVNAVFIPKKNNDETETERRALTDDEQKWILKTKHRAQRAAMIMMYAGLRRGEVIPLLWSDIDLNAKTINVNKSVEAIDGSLKLKKGGKTKCSERTVYIPDVLVDFLKKENRNNNMLVCPSTKGKMMSDSSWRRMWESYIHQINFENGDFSNVLDEYGNQFKLPASRFAPKKIPIVIPPITPHWLRHTFITMMYLAGIDVLTAKEQAGHADIQTTIIIYTHLDSQYKKKQISKLNDYLNKSTG